MKKMASYMANFNWRWSFVLFESLSSTRSVK